MKLTFLPVMQLRARVLAVLFLGLCGAAWGTVTDIANTPVLGGSGANAKPNIMLLMDTSNSMSWTHMPDQMEAPGAKQSIGYKSSQCNSIYYNPAQTYVRPKDAANASLPVPNYNAAPYNYYSTDASTVNLGTSFQAHDANTVLNVTTSVADTPQQAYYFVYTGSATTFTYNTSPCNRADNTAVGFTGNAGNGWRRVLVSATSGPGNTDERQNFAIWYTYYRTRLALAKSAIGRAFAPLDNSYRVGFLNGNPTASVASPTTITVNPTVQASRYEKIADFDSTQKTNWFSKFYGQQAGGSSPTREGLARVGRHYAGKTDGINTGMSEDPVIQACQANFAIVTTDGYWNVDAEKAAPGGGPTNIAGTAWVGQQDNPWTPDSGLRPSGVFDGTIANIGYTDTSTTANHYSYLNCSRTVTGQFTRTVYKSQQQYKKTVTTTQANNATQNQKQTSTLSKRTWNASMRTTQYKLTTTTYTETKLQSSWYNPATEITSFQPSCSGLTGCTTATLSSTTVTSCSPSSGSSPTWIRTQCSGPNTGAAGVASCTVGPNCTFSDTGVVPVKGSQCVNQTGNNGNQYVTKVCTITNDNTSLVSSCSGNIDSATGNQTCTINYSGWSNVASCTSSNGAYVGNPPTNTECSSFGYCSPNAGNNNCAASVVTTTGGACANGTSGNSTTTCTLVETMAAVAVNPATCVNDPTPKAANSWVGTICNTQDSAATVSPSCTPSPATSPSWAQTLCTGSVSVGGVYKQTASTTTTLRTYDNGTIVGPTVGSTSYVNDPTCLDPATAPALPADNTVTNPPVVVAGSTYTGSSNSLADVAQYYYVTDLRPSMADLVPISGTGWGDDRANWQHMTTFVVGLGVSGTLPYREDYPTATTGTMASIRAGTLGWPRWPDPTINYAGSPVLYNDPKSIDDFWHTAINGRGRFFSANNPDSVVSGIRGVISAIDATVAAGSGVTISDQVGVTLAGLNYAATYVTGSWIGDVQAKVSGSSTLFWSAKAKLDTQTGPACDDRRIYVRNTAGTYNLSEFTWNTTKCANSTTSTSLPAAMQASFVATGLSQYTDMNPTQVTQATGASLVNFLRGQRQNEGFVAGTSGKLYRSRINVLGDIISSKPQYVAAPFYNYVDSGYATFKSAQAARKGMIYVGANDGMLHAFYAPKTDDSAALLAKAGQEAWAYIPTKVMPNLTRLADMNYSGNHRYFVDGTPTVGDVASGGTWRTILVGGLNAGGKGFYALDITDPETPKSLWEFDSASTCSPACDVGLSFGKPVIAKLKDGTWVVLLTSGYNNSTGVGTLYVVNAVTGALVRQISTGVGTAANPSGLAQVSAWVNYPGVNEQALRAYGGDLLGNLWRFDLNDTIAPSGYDANLRAIAKDASGAVQPITTAPELGLFSKRPYVYFGTGRLLGSTDLTNMQGQSVYAIYDDVDSATPLGDLRSLLKRYTTQENPSPTLLCAGNASTCTAANDNGWMVDLSVSQEQINLPLTFVEGTLVIASNQPQSGICLNGAVTRVYLALGQGGESAAPGIKYPSDGVVGLTFVNRTTPATETTNTVNPNTRPGNVQFIPTTNSGVQGAPQNNWVLPPPPGANRVSWREVVQQ